MNAEQKMWTNKQAYKVGVRDARLRKERDLCFGQRSYAEYGVDLQDAYNVGWFDEIERFWDMEFSERKSLVVNPNSLLG